MQKLRKILRKPQPNFQHYVKEIEAQAKKWFSYKKTCTGPSMFTPSECLISLLSGVNAQEDVQKDLLRAEQVGKP